MSKTEEIALENGWDAKKLGEKVDTILSPMVNRLSESTRDSVDDAVDMATVAIQSLQGEDLQHASRDSILAVCIERVLRIKALDFISKAKAEITLYLLLFFTDATLIEDGPEGKKTERKVTALERIKQLLERQKFAALLNRSKECKAPWLLIDRLRDAGVKAKLSEVRTLFRDKLFLNYSIKAGAVKRQIAEAMFGFALSDAMYIRLIAGEKVEYTHGGAKFSRHVPSQLERFESAWADDRKHQREHDVDPNTRKAFAFDVAAIKAENEESMAKQLAALAAQKASEDAKKAEAEAEAERLRQQKANEIAAIKTENELRENASEAMEVLATEAVISQARNVPTESELTEQKAKFAAQSEQAKSERKRSRKNADKANAKSRKAVSGK